MTDTNYDPALIGVFAKGFDRHVEGVGGYAELDGAAVASALHDAGWEATWADDDEDNDLADAMSSAWAECAEPHGDEDDDGMQPVSASPREVLDNLGRVGITFAKAA